MIPDDNLHTDFFNEEELARYSRHFSLSQVGLQGQVALKSARVLCVGAGGLGSPVLLYLAAAGVGTIGIMDHDVVALSNLQRQILYTTQDIKHKKVAAAQQKLNLLNPHVVLITHDIQLIHENALDLVNEYDIVVDGTDNFSTRYIINDACFHLKKPLVYGSIFQFEGQCSVFNYKEGPCYRCLYDAPPPPGLIPNCAAAGVLGILPGLVGSIQATEVIKLILNIGTPLSGRLLRIDALSMQFQTFTIKRHPTCRLCTYQEPFNGLPHHNFNTCQTPLLDNEITSIALYQLMKQSDNYILLDVREPYEYAICHLDNVTLIPLAQLTDGLTSLDKNKFYIVYCKTGIRGYKAMQLLQKAGFGSVKNLAGGIMAWREEIDNTIVAY